MKTRLFSLVLLCSAMLVLAACGTAPRPSTSTPTAEFSEAEAIARAREDAQRSAPELGIIEAHIDSVEAERLTLEEADRRFGTHGYGPGQNKDTPVWFVRVRGVFRYQGMMRQGTGTPAYDLNQADERVFGYDARTGEPVGSLLLNARTVGTLMPGVETPPATVVPALTPVATPSARGAQATATPAIWAMNVVTTTSVSLEKNWIAQSLAALPRNGGESYYTQLTVASTTDAARWTPVDIWASWGLGYTIPEPFAWSRDGRYLYFTNKPRPDGCAPFINGWDLNRLDLQNGMVTQVFPGGTLWLALSPDERTLAYAGFGERGLVLRDLASGQEHETGLKQRADHFVGDQIGHIQWSADGSALVYTLAVRPCKANWAESTSIVRVDVATLGQKTLIKEDERLFTTVSWSGQGVVLKDKDGGSWSLDPQTGEVTLLSPGAAAGKTMVPRTGILPPAEVAKLPAPAGTPVASLTLPYDYGRFHILPSGGVPRPFAGLQLPPGRTIVRAFNKSGASAAECRTFDLFVDPASLPPGWQAEESCHAGRVLLDDGTSRDGTYSAAYQLPGRFGVGISRLVLAPGETVDLVNDSPPFALTLISIRGTPVVIRHPVPGMVIEGQLGLWFVEDNLLTTLGTTVRTTGGDVGDLLGVAEAIIAKTPR